VSYQWRGAPTAQWDLPRGYSGILTHATNKGAAELLKERNDAHYFLRESEPSDQSPEKLDGNNDF
jgi:hypothetical protein